jgi:hypothetical protein
MALKSVQDPINCLKGERGQEQAHQWLTGHWCREQFRDAENRASGRRVVSGRLSGGLCGPELHVDFAAENGAPILVLGDRHPAFHANTDSLLWWFAALTQQSLQQ